MRWYLGSINFRVISTSFGLGPTKFGFGLAMLRCSISAPGRGPRRFSECEVEVGLKLARLGHTRAEIGQVRPTSAKLGSMFAAIEPHPGEFSPASAKFDRFGPTSDGYRPT